MKDLRDSGLRGRAGALLLLALLSGCTYVVQGTSQPVTFTSEPPGASFTVAGQTATTPATLELPKDDYQISFHRGGYKDASVELRRKMSAWFIGSIAMGVIASTIDLATGAWREFETTDVRVTLQPLPDTVQELPHTILSDPPGAEILIGQRSYGLTPRELRLPWGPQEREKVLTLRLTGYAPKTAALLRSEKRLIAVLEALPVPVSLTVASTPAGAEVRLDGHLEGKTPLPLSLSWKKGDKPRVLELALDGYRPEKRPVDPETRDLTVALQEVVEVIVLPLRIEPAGARVQVDGVALPEGVRQVKLGWSVSMTRHTLSFSQPGYATKNVEVKRAAAAGPLEVRLAPALPGNP